MQHVYLQKKSYEQMLEHLPRLSKEEISQHLKSLGCFLSYQEIYEQLLLTYNDLAVSDRIFENYTICDDTTEYPKTFIDEAVLEIAKRETFPFPHYGLISSSIDVLIQQDEYEVSRLLEQYRLLFKMAKYFQITSLEGISYQINDGVDMLSATMILLDRLMYQGRKDKQAYLELISFVDKFLAVFCKSSDVLRISLLYEQAQAYIAVRSSKGEQLFKQLLKTHGDPTDVVLHYGLAYLDDDEQKALKIFERYRTLLRKDSEAYEVIQEIKKEYIKKR